VKAVPALAALLTVACTSPSTPAPSASPATSASTTAPATTAPATTAPATTPPVALPTSFGGADVRWPVTRETTPLPPALGAVVTVRIAGISGGGTLAAGLTLPRIGGTAANPRVLTPCGHPVTLSAADLRAVAPGSGGRLPKRPQDVLVLVDPGHGGPFQLGAKAPNGDFEKTRNLQIAFEVRTALAGRVGRVVLTRERDFEETIEFRTALADALRVDAALSVHLNSSPDGPRPTPGTETFGSTADGLGRRFAGLVYEHVRGYVQTLPGPWVGDRDAGAKYRLSAKGRDYYGLLRQAHRPFVISESLYISSAHEASLVARPEVRAGLGRAMADALVELTTGTAPGSGWVTPYQRPADPSTRDGHICVDPAR
jgi:N-acetylmuramoyl-L-alanine amidase